MIHDEIKKALLFLGSAILLILFGGAVMQFALWHSKVEHSEAVKAWGVYVEFISVFGAISAGLLAAVRYLIHRDDQLTHERQKFMVATYEKAKQTYERLLSDVARLAALEATGSPVSKEDVQKFLELYYGPMLEFEDHDISETMDRIKTNVLGNLHSPPDAVRENSLDGLSRQLRMQCDAYLDKYHSQARRLTIS